MKRGALFLLCDSDSERENHLGSQSLRCGICRDRMREREREKEQQGGWDNYTLFVHPGIRIQNAGVMAKRLSADAVFNENKKKKSTLFTPLRSFTVLQCHN